MKDNIYVYVLNKKIENPVDFFEKTKSKYEARCSDLLASLNSYAESGGKMKKDEKKLVASLILESAFDLLNKGTGPLPSALKRDGYGKPFLVGVDTKISISHNEDFVAIAYTKMREIGIDIENEIAEEKAERLSARFPQIASLNIQSSSGKVDGIYAFEMTESGALTPLNLTPADDSFTAKWTAAEATMKCDGRGFSALPELVEILKTKTALSYVLYSEHKKTYVSFSI